jgi:hypothetical protein
MLLVLFVALPALALAVVFALGWLGENALTRRMKKDQLKAEAAKRAMDAEITALIGQSR